MMKLRCDLCGLSVEESVVHDVRTTPFTLRTYHTGETIPCTCHVAVPRGAREVSIRNMSAEWAVCPECWPMVRRRAVADLYERACKTAIQMKLRPDWGAIRAAQVGFWIHLVDHPMTIPEVTQAFIKDTSGLGRCSEVIEQQLYYAMQATYKYKTLQQKMDKFISYSVLQAVTTGIPIFITADIVTVLTDALNSYPEAPLDLSEAPAQRAFAYLAGSTIQVLENQNHLEGTVEAISWEIDKDIVYVVLYGIGRDATTGKTEVRQPLGGTVFHNGTTVESHLEGPLTLTPKEYQEQAKVNAKRTLHLLMSVWSFMQQRIVTKVGYLPDRAARKRLDREAPDHYPFIEVVQFRRHAGKKVVNPGSGTPLGHRVYVAPYWANHWYPSEGIHRRILRAESIRGPEDAPLKHTRKLYAVVR